MAVTISDTGLDWRAVIVALLSVCLVSWLIVSVCNWLARTVRQIAALVFSERQPAATRNPHHRRYVPESVSDSDTQALTCSIYERALAGKQVVVVNSEETWSSVADRLTSYCRRLPILGLDCEWLPNGFGFTGPDCVVALLQLATLDGLCVLVQLSQFDIDDCPQLEKILGDKDVLKVGVAVREDCRRLWLRCCVPVAGCVDLRRVADRHQHHHAGLRDVDALKTGLAKLAEAVLGMQVAKDKKVTLSRWDNEQLSREQKEYAANDALYSVLVFAGLLSYDPGLKRVFDCAIDKHLLRVLPATDALWWHYVHSACEGLVEDRIQPVSAPRYSFENVGSRHSSWQPVRDTVTDSVKSRGTRQTHLYDNARLLDPDGHPLSVVDERKAKWYLRKNLAKLVCESPLTVRLLFEPAGRPQGEGRHGAYYLLEKLNQCVCCGAGESYARKNIVPQEYRKHFPEIMKSHQSHDVLLLCVECHRRSAVHDLEMKRQLAKLCNAPFNSGQNSKVSEDAALKSLRSAARALLSHRDTLPETRYVELYNMLSEYLGCSQLSHDQVAEVAQLGVQTYNDGHVSHGERVCGFYGRLKQRYNDEGGGGLVLLEKRWRRHFLASMRPRFMPRLWSVDHNHVKIATKLRHADWPAARKRAVWRLCFGAEYPCLSQ